MIFTKILQKMLKLDLILQTMNLTGRYQKEKNTKVFALMEDELGGKIMTKFVGSGAKSFSYLTDDGTEDKKVNAQKRMSQESKLKFENYKNYLEVTQLGNKIKYLEKNKINIDSLRKS